MQKDLSSIVAQEMTNSDSIPQMITLIKNQANEIQKRGNIIMDLEDKSEMLQKNVLIITASNRQLESMIETLKDERVKLLEEIELLKIGSGLKQEKIVKKKNVKQNQPVLGQ
jgi:ribosomal silencing factor RsfS